MSVSFVSTFHVPVRLTSQEAAIPERGEETMMRRRAWIGEGLCLWLLGWVLACAQTPEAVAPTQPAEETSDGIQERAVPQAESEAEYRQRELNAPPAVKQKLQALREMIKAKNLNFGVGYTSVSALPLEKITGFIPPTPQEYRESVKRQRALATQSPERDQRY